MLYLSLLALGITIGLFRGTNVSYVRLRKNPRRCLVSRGCYLPKRRGWNGPKGAGQGRKTVSIAELVKLCVK